MINTNKIHIYIHIDHMKTAETVPQGCTFTSFPVKSVFFFYSHSHTRSSLSPPVAPCNEQAKYHLRARKKIMDGRSEHMRLCHQ
jgi:hypothetical protein